MKQAIGDAGHVLHSVCQGRRKLKSPLSGPCSQARCYEQATALSAIQQLPSIAQG